MSESNGNGHADKVLPGVEIEFGNPKKKYMLVFSLRALIEIHKLTGKNPLNGELFTTMGPEDFAKMIWAGTLHMRHNMTVDQITDQIDFNDFRGIAEQIRKAYAQASPADVESTEKKTEDQPGQQTG